MRKSAVVLKNVKSVGLVSAFGAALLAGCNAANNSTADALDVGGQNNLKAQQVASVQDLRAFCPRVIVRGGTETLRVYEPAARSADPDAPKTIRFQATITEVVRECNYNGDFLNIRVGVRGRVINGPTGANGTLELPIRVAATNAKKEVPYTYLHKQVASINPGGSFANFSFVDGNINVAAPKNKDLILYVGFDEGPIDEKKN